MFERLSRVLWLLRHGGRLSPMFSQHGEDVALRALLKPQRSGVYVDVGANDPIDGSNTAWLYMAPTHLLSRSSRSTGQPVASQRPFQTVI